MPRYTIENTTGRAKAFKVYGGLAEVPRHSSRTLDLSHELDDLKISELAASGVYVVPEDAPATDEEPGDNPPADDDTSNSGEPESGKEDLSGLSDEDLAKRHKAAFGKLPHPNAKRDTILKKLLEA